MVKKKMLLCATLLMLLGVSVPSQAAWKNYVKPGVIGTVAGIAAASLGGGILDLDNLNGSIIAGCLGSAIPLFSAALFNAGVSDAAPVNTQQKQKKGVLITSGLVGALTVAAGTLATWIFPVLMGAGAPGAQPLLFLAKIMAMKTAKFSIGHALAATAAYHCW